MILQIVHKIIYLLLSVFINPHCSILMLVLLQYDTAISPTVYVRIDQMDIKIDLN